MPPSASRCFAHDPGDLLGLADVGAEGDGPRAAAASSAATPSARSASRSTTATRGARRAQGERHRPPDAAPAADDQRGLAGQESGYLAHAHDRNLVPSRGRLQVWPA